ncbi:hypothetical protein POKO110462_12910 [Pontibacter korlensis]|uniref:GAF domain-containing protein n=1 Tax=Pontibacter korlensis TaxID=400092 RepID=A0A0E3UX88_9BACT|nr:hypothetical protein [Pontibacter korlensis]AKD04022.1 hypothetical protein PKOR_14115 [Pontibacter korlensis]
MEYRHIQYWQYEPGVEEERILEAALVLSQKPRHDTYLVELANFIAEHVGVKYVMIGQLSADRQHVHTLVYLAGRELLQNYTYSIKGSPCENTLTHKFCYYPYDVAPAFPGDKDLQDLQIESYLGSMLLSEDNEPMGLVVLMDEKKITNAAFAEHLIMVLSPAIEKEIKMRSI